MRYKLMQGKEMIAESSTKGWIENLQSLLEKTGVIGTIKEEE